MRSNKKNQKLERPENREKAPRGKDKTQQQTQPLYDARSGKWTWATLVGGEHPREGGGGVLAVYMTGGLMELHIANQKNKWT